MSIDALIAELGPVLGPEGILTDDQVSARQAGIWRPDKIMAPVIFRPASADEVSRVLKACHAAAQPVVTHGGLTGLVEGALAQKSHVVLSTERLNQIENLSVSDRSITVQAGVTLQAAQTKAMENGLMLAVDLGARGTCTLGGNASTNAGGHQVIRYGMMRDSILGLEVVLADGTVLNSLNSMLKNNAGYDLKHLFIGAEGTLGVITRLVIRLRPASSTQETALLACRSFDEVGALLNRLDQALGGTLSAFEVMWQDYYQLVAGNRPPLPQGYPFYVLTEALGGSPDIDRERFIEAIAAAEQAGQLAEAVIAKSGAERDAFWQMRDSVEKILELGPARVFDVSLPLSLMPAYVDEVRHQLASAAPGCASFVFGHAGDGNLHIVCVPQEKDDAMRDAIEAAVYTPLKKLRGSVSGEHGIGLEKKAWLHISRNPVEIDVMRQLKATLDPKGILNPGLIFD